jgi:hypothetical protein
MGGSSTVSINSPRVNNIQVQQSAYGTPIAMVYGRCRVSVNLGWNADFQAIAHTTTQSSGGKGGGSVDTKTTTYSYVAAVIMFIGEKIKNVRSVFRDKEVFTDSGSYIATITGSAVDIGTFTPGGNVTIRDAGALNNTYEVVSVGTTTMTISVPSNTPTITAEAIHFGILDAYGTFIGHPGTLDYTAGASALGALGLSLMTGETGQSVWPYLTTNHPDQALGYSQVAYLYSPSYQLNDNAGLQNHTLEVDSTVQFPGKPDADPAAVFVDILSNATYGVSGWPADLIGDMTEFSDSAVANNLLVSPCYDSQRQASDVLQELVQAVNCEMVWSEGLLKVRSYCDEPATANGRTFTPNLSPLFNLNDDDFLGADGDDPVTVDRSQGADAYNCVQLEFINRAHQYNTETIIAFDQADAEEFGLRKKDPVALHLFCDAAIARKAVQLMLQRVLYVRNTYQFKLGWQYAMLEPMDLVTISDSGLGLVNKLVRIKLMEENEDGEWSVTAEDVEPGTASAPVYQSQAAEGWINDQNADPGNVLAPIFINPPSTYLADNTYELWLAVAGANQATWGGCEVWASVSNSKYKRIGVIYGPSRFGSITASFPAAADPDTTNTLSVDTSDSGAFLVGATQDDVDAAQPLCWLGGELIAYRDSLLTGADQFDLSYIRRGLYSTGSASHAPGTSFVRIDNSIFKYGYQAGQIGKTLYVKLLSFNKYMRELQTLADVTAYTTTTTPNVPTPNQVTGVHLVSPFESTYFTITWNIASRATSYDVRIYASDGTTLLRLVNTHNTTLTYTLTDATADSDVERTYKITVTAKNVSGDGATSSVLTVTNNAPSAVAGVSSSGSAPTVNVAWGNVSVPDFAGYLAYYSTTNGFNPASAGTQFYQGTATSASISGLIGGTTYYVRIAAYDTWSNDRTQLNFSAQHSFIA